MPCRYGMLNQRENEELMGLAADGAFAEYIAVKVKFCWSLNKLEEKFERDDILKIGTLIEPLGCAYNGVFFSSGWFYTGAYVIFYGTGPTGLTKSRSGFYVKY